MQSSSFSAALIVTLFQAKHSSWSDIQLHAANEWKMSVRGTYIKSEKLSLTSWTLSVPSTGVNKDSSKVSNIRLWFDLCPRRDLQRHKYNNLDSETCPDLFIHFFKPCGAINFPLQLWSSSPHCIFYWSSWKFSFPKQSENEKLVPWYRDNSKD